MDNTSNKNKPAFYKVNDWYANHNVGTRMSMFVFLGVYVYLALTAVTPVAVGLVTTASYLAFGSFLIVTLGDNAISKVGDIILRLKSK